MILKNFVNNLTQNEKEELLGLLQSPEWDQKDKDKLLSEIADLKKEFVNDKEIIELDCKLIITNELIIEDMNINNGNYPYINFLSTGKIKPNNGAKVNKQYAILQQNFSDFLEHACDDILKLTPNLKKKQEILYNKAGKIIEKINSYKQKGLTLN